MSKKFLFTGCFCTPLTMSLKPNIFYQSLFTLSNPPKSYPQPPVLYLPPFLSYPQPTPPPPPHLPTLPAKPSSSKSSYIYFSRQAPRGLDVQAHCMIASRSTFKKPSAEFFFFGGEGVEKYGSKVRLQPLFPPPCLAPHPPILRLGSRHRHHDRHQDADLRCIGAYEIRPD